MISRSPFLQQPFCDFCENTMEIVTWCWPPGSGPLPVTHTPEGALAVLGRVGTMASPSLLGTHPTLGEICLQPIQLGACTLEAAHLWKTVYPRGRIYCFGLTSCGLSTTLLTKQESVLPGCRIHRPLVSSQYLMLRPYPAGSHYVIYGCSLHKRAFATWLRYPCIALQSLTSACPHPGAFLQ